MFVVSVFKYFTCLTNIKSVKFSDWNLRNLKEIVKRSVEHVLKSSDRTFPVYKDGENNTDNKLSDIILLKSCVLERSNLG